MKSPRVTGRYDPDSSKRKCFAYNTYKVKKMEKVLPPPYLDRIAGPGTVLKLALRGSGGSARSG